MNVAQETLGFRRQGLSPCLSLLMSAFALLMAPACLSTHLHSPRERSSTTPSDSSTSLHLTPSQRRHRSLHSRHSRVKCELSKPWKRFATRSARGCARLVAKRGETNLSESLEIRSFGYRLEPRYIFRAGRLDQ